MPRAIAFEWPVDTRTFNCLQLQPGVVAALAWSALARWLRSYLVPFPRLIGEHDTGLVVMGFHLHYHEPGTFFDMDAIRVLATLRSMRQGERAVLDLSVRRPDEVTLADARLVLCPVRIVEPHSLAATPAPFDARLGERFRPDETTPLSPARVVPELRTDVETGGSLIAEATRPFTIHRHLTEVAEQWSWTELPALLEASREAMATRDDTPRVLLRAVSCPLRRLDIEFTAPLFSFESGATRSRAYDCGEAGLALVHRVTSDGGRVLNATAVERI